MNEDHPIWTAIGQWLRGGKKNAPQPAQAGEVRLSAWADRDRNAPVVAGNVDLAHRPVVHNPDGSVSTVYSSSSGQGGMEVLVPGVSQDGRLMTPDEAWQEYLRTGKHLGKFGSVQDANAYADALHSQHWTYHRDPTGREYATFVGGPGPNTPPGTP